MYLHIFIDIHTNHSIYFALHSITTSTLMRNSRFHSLASLHRYVFIRKFNAMVSVAAIFAAIPQRFKRLHLYIHIVFVANLHICQTSTSVIAHLNVQIVSDLVCVGLQALAADGIEYPFLNKFACLIRKSQHNCKHADGSSEKIEKVMEEVVNVIRLDQKDSQGKRIANKLLGKCVFFVS